LRTLPVKGFVVSPRCRKPSPSLRGSVSLNGNGHPSHPPLPAFLTVGPSPSNSLLSDPQPFRAPFPLSPLVLRSLFHFHCLLYLPATPPFVCPWFSFCFFFEVILKPPGYITGARNSVPPPPVPLHRSFLLNPGGPLASPPNRHQRLALSEVEPFNVFTPPPSSGISPCASQNPPVPPQPPRHYPPPPPWRVVVHAANPCPSVLAVRESTSLTPPFVFLQVRLPHPVLNICRLRP